MALEPGQLVNSSGIRAAERHVDYGTDDPNAGHSDLSNVQQNIHTSAPDPYTAQTRSRATSLFAFRSNVEAQGTFIKDPPQEFHVESDPGSRFALDKQME